jgi:hypothetical protein
LRVAATWPASSPARRNQEQVSRDLRAGKPDADPARLTDAILQVTQLSARARSLQERANQAGITLPSISPNDEAALARTPAEPAWAWLWLLLVPVGAAAVALLRFRSLPPSKAHR